MREFRLRIRDYAKFVAQHPRIKNLSEEQREKLIEFVAGNMLFALLHELALVRREGTPAVGRIDESPETRKSRNPRGRCSWIIGKHFPGFDVMTWNGLMAPSGTPRDIVGRIAQQIRKAAGDPIFARRLDGYGAAPLGNTPEDFQTMIAADTKLWAEAVRFSDIKLQ
jgi:hypothetical protein